jgi:hypothetical protein
MPSHQKAIKERAVGLNQFQARIAAAKAAAHELCLANRKPKKVKGIDWAHASPEERAAWCLAKEIRLARRD